jgi:hypothetical protein
LKWISLAYFDPITMADMRLRLNKAIVERQKKRDISEMLLPDDQGGREYDIATHFHIPIQEIQRGRAKRLKRTGSRRQSGCRRGNLNVRQTFQ